MSENQRMKTRSYYKNKNTTNLNEDILVGAPPISKLNDDCLRTIFSYLEVKERIRVQTVCRQWLKIGKLPWTDFRYLDIDQHKEPYLGKVLTKKRMLVQVLNLCGSSITHFGYTMYEPYLCSCYDLLVILHKFCPNLRSLNIVSVKYTKKALEYLADNFTGLEKFSIHSIDPGLEESLSRFFSLSKQLHTVDIQINKNITGVCFHGLLVDVLQSLTISVTRDILLQNLKSMVPNLTKLHTFNLTERSPLTSRQILDEILNLLPNTKNFENLTLRREWCIPNEPYIQNLHRFTNLCRLELHRCPLVNDPTLAVVGKYCKELTWISLNNSNAVTDSSLQSITSLPKLEYLSLNCLSQITDNIFKNMPELRTLKCSACYHIRLPGLSHILRTSEKLEVLDVRMSLIGNDVLINSAKIAVTTRTNAKVLHLGVQYYGNRPDKFIQLLPNLRLVLL